MVEERLHSSGHTRRTVGSAGRYNTGTARDNLAEALGCLPVEAVRPPAVMCEVVTIGHLRSPVRLPQEVAVASLEGL